MHKRGALIVLEGLDRSGKSTQCEKLVEALKSLGHMVKTFKFPDRTTQVGKMINSYLQNNKELDDHTVHLLFSANRWEKSLEMLDNLNKGVTLIIDRYAYSGVAFTYAKKGFSLNWCKHPDSGLPEPDLVLFLNVEESEAEKRGGYGEERYEKKEFQKQVCQNFMELKSGQWKIVDANKSIEEVHNDILTAAKETIENVHSNPVGRLWVE